MRLAGTSLRDHPTRTGLTREGHHGPVWTGELRLNEKLLTVPSLLNARSHIIVCAHGDLFHHNAPPEWLDRIFVEMERAPHHIFQILTKRADRMRDYWNSRYFNRAPPRNILLGVSVERQEETNIRVPLLLETRAAIRYVTFYPLLAAINIRAIPAVADSHLRQLAFVQVGQESQRPALAEWIAQIEADAKELGIPFQLGDRLRGEEA